MHKYLLILVPFLIVGILAGTFGAYTAYKKMPAFSMKFVRNSIADHDWDTFSSYVDVDSIVAEAAGELLEDRMAKIEKDTAAYSMKQMSDTYEQQVRPEFIQTVTKAFENYISHGRIKFPENRELTDTERLLKRYQINAMELAGVGKPTAVDGEGKMALNFTNSELRTSFELEARIALQDDGSWKITGVSGWKNAAKILDKALDAKLQSMNRPIQQKMDDIVNVKEIRAEIGPRDEYGFSETLSMKMKADIKSDQPLSRITGRIHIEVPDGEDTFAPFELDMAFHPQGLQTFPVDKVLNPFVRSDVKIMRHGLTRNAFRAEITGVEFLDGKRLELLTALPD